MKDTNSAEGALEAYKRAGKIASRMREKVKQLTRPGVAVINICNETENSIRSSGAVPAFPLNVSIDDVAAHYTSPPGDTSLIPENALVKLDLGVSVNGYIVDTALTVDLSQEESVMVNTAEQALKAAFSVIKAGTDISEVSKVISSVISSSGLKPISNLTGHSITRYELHSGISVPNVATRSGHVMREGEVYAIEPFVTKPDGKGYVKDTDRVFIFSCSENGPTASFSNDPSVTLLLELKKRFGKLPFALRWADAELDLKQFKKLLRSGSVISYPVLVESGKKRVAQAEHTVLVKRHGCDVLTI